MNRPNVITRGRAPLNKDMKHYRRYSNYDPNEAPIGPTMEGGGFTYNDGTGSGAFDWNTFFSNLLNSGSSIVNSIWGRNNIQQANYTNELYKQEQRTNTILWVVIGVVLALLVFLVIRKSK